MTSRSHSGGAPIVRAVRGPPAPHGTRAAADLEAIARTAHEVIRAWCAFVGDPTPPPWDEAPLWQRESTHQAVRFFCDNPDADDSATHEAWLAEKRRAGWTYGPVKDADLRRHPCMVPFSQLPKEQQFKDRLLRVVVRSGLGLCA